MCCVTCMCLVFTFLQPALGVVCVRVHVSTLLFVALGGLRVAGINEQDATWLSSIMPSSRYF